MSPKKSNQSSKPVKTGLCTYDHSSLAQPRYEDVTPEAAQALVDTAPSELQRAVSRKTVQALVREIKAGKYYPIHLGAATDWDGHTMDSIHRFTAIAESGVTCTMMVTRGLDPSWRAVMGDCKKWSTGAQYKQSGAPIFESRYVGIVESMSRTPFTAQEKIAFEINHRGSATFAYELRSRLVKAKSLNPDMIPNGMDKAPVFGVIACAHAGKYVSPERLDTFVSILITGSYGTDEDMAASTLRNWLTAHPRKISDLRYTTQAAVRAFADKVPWKKAIGVQSDLFPIRGAE